MTRSTPVALHSSLSLNHFLLALAVVAVWGTNFVVIRLGLDQLPPFLFSALRFTFALVPALFFLPLPKVAWRNMALYGVLIGVGQFGLLYLAINGNISPGLASLVIQTQVFFTIGFSMRVSGERVQPFQWFALLMASGGIATIALHTDGSTTFLGLFLVLCAAVSWAGANMAAKRASPQNMLAYVVWASAFSLPPLFLISLLTEGWPVISTALVHADWRAWAAVLWQSWGNTLFGYAVWGWLLARHPAATITPMALMVPIFGMSASAFWLGESLPPWKLGAAALVMGGLGMNLLWPKLKARLQQT
jgi:O-acetylserine/cysteine efflux transporter